MGFGDVKAGIALGFALGLVHWQLALAALALATGLTAAIGLLARARTVPLGPGLVAAATLALVAAPLFAPLDGQSAAAALHPSAGVHR
jgi:prepilin signal peptidase PulO-like enzyme (type II secretory pathway)